MKKIWLLFIVILLLASCGNNNNSTINTSDIESKLDINKKLVNVQDNVKKVEEKLKKSGLTWEKLEKMVKKQEKWYEMIANLKWDARKKYVFEKEVLPKLIEDKNITPDFCKTNNMDLYLKCLSKKNIDIDEVKNKLPESMQEYVEKEYYYQKYLTNRKDILKKTNNPIALEQKKRVILQLVTLWALNKKSCSKIPELDVKKYCESLFIKQKD